MMSPQTTPVGVKLFSYPTLSLFREICMASGPVSEYPLFLHFKVIQYDQFYENLTLLCFSWTGRIFLTSKTFVYWTSFSTNVFKCMLRGCACRNKIKKQRIMNKIPKRNYHVELMFRKCLHNK